MPRRVPRSLLPLVLVLGAVLLLAPGGCGREGEAPPASAPVTLAAALASRGEIVRPDADGAVREAFEALEAADATAPSSTVTIDYPLDGSVFPPDYVPPTFLWHDEAEAADAWRVDVSFPDEGARLSLLVAGPPPPRGEIDPAALGSTNEVYEPTPYQASARSWTPSPGTWEAIQQRGAGKRAVVEISGFAAGAPSAALSRGRVTIETSTDPVGAPIFYRDVPLMPNVGKAGVIQPLSKNALPLIAWRLRDVTKPESRLLLEGMPSCANCHSFSLDGKTMGMDVDGPDGDKGSYTIAPVEKHMVISTDKVITWNAFADKPEGHKTIGFLSRISPDGRYALTTLNESLYVANFTNYRFLQVFYPTRGILAWYSTETGEMKALPGADDPAYVHTNGVWTPDGETVVFSRAAAVDPYPPGRPIATRSNDPNEVEIRYDLYRMPFDGGKGGTPVPIEGASDNGVSNTFPKVSPDGRWIVFTKCRNGQLMRPDGRLWIVPAEGGEAREMRCNTPLMNSWHSFSPNGRWMVFSSKWNTPYTRMFLTHLDEDGNDTPPILVPGSTAANRAVNIPEFLNADYEALLDIQVPAVNHHRYFGRGVELMREEHFAEAVEALQEAVALDPEFSRAHVNLAYALDQVGRREEAIRHYEKALEINRDDPLAHNGLGSIYEAMGRRDEAIRHFQQALAADPNLFLTRRNLGLAMAREGRVDEALVHLRSALRKQSRDVEIHRTLAVLLMQHGRVAQALPHLEAVVAVAPDDVRARTLWAWLLATSPEDGLRDGEKAVRQALEACTRTRYEKVEPLDALAAAYAEAGRYPEAVETAQRALQRARNPELAAGIQERLDLYRQGKPYRSAAQ